MKKKQVLSLVRQAIDDYQMIEENDCIAIGISGGKDSLTLLVALAELCHFYPINFTIKAITIDLGFENINFDKIKNLCKELNVEYHIEKTDIAQIIFEERKEKNPCSLCAKLRKGCLNEIVKNMGCNKVAYAHHKDDVVETMLLSLIYEGRFHTFSPVTSLDRSQVTIIRPLIYINEYDVISFAKNENLPVVKSLCPADGHTKREDMHILLKDLEYKSRGTKNRMFTAICDSNINGWKSRK